MIMEVGYRNMMREVRKTRDIREETRIKRDIKGFIGWDYIERIVDISSMPSLTMALFLTGGRATEILELTRANFADIGGVYEVRNMPVFKRYRMIEKYIDSKGKSRWKTRLQMVYRTFPILKIHPLANRFWDSIKNQEGKLFYWEEYKDQYWQLYKRIRKIEPPYNSMLPKTGTLYPHWFRGMRAAQLRIEYNLDIDQLMRFFQWINIETARHYAGLSSINLVEAMNRGREFVKRFSIDSRKAD